MDFKLEINRLSQDELTYELACRGVSETLTVDTARKTLRGLLRIERSSSYVAPTYPFSFAEDLAAVRAKVTEIEGLIDAMDGQVSRHAKIASKLAHLQGRVNRAIPQGSEEIAQRSSLVVKVVSLMAKYSDRFASFRTVAGVTDQILDLSAAEPQAHSSAVSVSDCDDSSDSDEVTQVRQGTSSQIKSLPVHQWHLTFSGDPGRISLAAFLQRVEELRIARGVHKATLFRSALDLFDGNALIWYRANRRYFSNWDELVIGLREQFQPANYNDRLYNEIRRRTQGPREDIGIYVSVMQNLFSRLSVQVSGTTQLQVILKNLHPRYRSALWSMNIQSLSQLIREGRRFEASCMEGQSYVPPPQKSQVMEPDLACMYVDPVASSSVAEVSLPNRSSQSCWNCGKVGHISPQCTEPQKRHCFTCGRPDVTKLSCPTCKGLGRSRGRGNFNRRN